MMRDTSIADTPEGTVLERHLETAHQHASYLSMIYGRLSMLSDRLIGPQPEMTAPKEVGGPAKTVAYLDQLRDINANTGNTIDAIINKLNEIDRLI